MKYWASRRAPLYGLVKMEVTGRLKNKSMTTELKATMEITGSGTA